MSFLKHGNFGYSTVLYPPSPANSGTTLDLATGGGALMPALPFRATVYPRATLPLLANAEIVEVTAVVGDTLTIVRQKEGTNARTILATDQFAATWTSEMVDQYAQGAAPAALEVAVPASSAAAGTKGQWAVSGGFMYLCVATNTWIMYPVVDSF